MKLSPAQATVIELMQAGWELRVSMRPGGGVFGISARLVRDGFGSGDALRKVGRDTLDVLKKLGLIEIASEEFPTRTYRLVKANPIR